MQSETYLCQLEGVMHMRFPASRVRRIEAACTTFLPVFLAIVALVYLVGVVVPIDDLVRKSSLDPKVADRWVIFACIGIPIAFLILDGAEKRATYGMRVRNLRYGDPSGSEITYFRGALRVAAGVLLLPLVPLSFVICCIDQQGRTLADLICGTIVWQTEQTSGFPVESFRMTESTKR